MKFKYLSLGVIFFTFAASSVLHSADPDPEKLWKQNCAVCHGPDGLGTPVGKALSIKDLTDAALQKELTAERIVTAIKEGRKDANGRLLMPPNGSRYDEAELKALVEKVKSYAPKEKPE